MRLAYEIARALSIAVLLLLLPLPLYAQDDGVFTLTADSLRGGRGAELHRLQWRYHAGDEAAWADPQSDDSSWEVLSSTRLTPLEQPRSGWRGIGWFRLHLRVDPRLAGEQLGLVLRHLGASEIYVDGKLVKQFGRVGATVESEQEFNPTLVPFGIVFNEGGEHLIAVRYSMMAVPNLNSALAGWTARNTQAGVGFLLQVNTLHDAIAEHRAILIGTGFLNVGMGVLFLAVAALHLLLFSFYPRLRANLFFGLYAFTRFIPLLLNLIPLAINSGVWFFAVRSYISFSVTLLAAALGLTYFYIAFNRRVPAHFKIFVAACILPSILFLLFPNSQAGVWLYSATLLFTAIELARVIIQAVIRRVEGAWIVGVGVLFIVPFVIFSAISPALGSVPAFLPTLLGLTGDIGLLLANSIYLARQFAGTNKNLEAKLVEVETLSAERLEQERAAAELRLEREQERAERALIEQELALAADIQKGLFPAELPAIEGYDIAARNRPARLCGGDYYDAIPIGDGGDANGSTLLLCVADVAGKGLDASLLMSNMQATLHALSGHTRPLAELAAQINKRLYAASPPNKFVTAILLEINPATSEGRYINAGHNSCLLTRKTGNTVELLKSTGLPLGMMPDASYEELSFRLQAGDMLALYSDGVPEAYDEQEQEWGETKLQDCLGSGMNESAENIVSKIFDEIDSFAGAAPQHDDITLLVFKKSERTNSNMGEPAMNLQNVA